MRFWLDNGCCLYNQIGIEPDTGHQIISEVMSCWWPLTLKIERKLMSERRKDASLSGPELLTDIIYAILTAENICCICLLNTMTFQLNWRLSPHLLPLFSLVWLNGLHRMCSLNAQNNTPLTYCKCLAELSHGGTSCYPSYFFASLTLFSCPPLLSG